MERNILGREAILAAKRKTEEVECPELGGTILLRELSVGQLRQLDNTDIGQQLSKMIVNDEGVLMFDDPEGVAILNNMSATVSIRLITAAATLNGVSQAAVDESIKNLIASPKDDSATA